MYKSVKAALFLAFGRDVPLEIPKDRSFGHFSSTLAFGLAKELKKSPKIIAEEFSKLLLGNPIFSEVDVIGGYINTKLSLDYLDSLTSKALGENIAFGKSTKEHRVLLEFVSANPTGPLHIGHARGACIGDTLLKIGKHLGYAIDSEYYVNDFGNQINLLGLSILLSGQENILKQDVEYPESYYRGDYINDIAESASLNFGNTIFEDEANIGQLSEFGKDLMLKEIKNNLFEIGITFDNFVSEKEMYKRWNEVLDRLEKNGAIFKDETSKIWLKSSEFGDEKDRVIVRENGEATYLAGDIVYHLTKFERNYDSYINIWGADHHGYIDRLKASIRYLGFDDSKLEIILSQMVSLLKNKEPYKMSKRAGNFILLKDVVKDIGSESLRFIFLSKKSDTHLEFDVEDLKRLDSSNPVFYINYANARIHSIFEKGNIGIKDVIYLKLENVERQAQDLLFLSLLLPHTLEESFKYKDTQKLTDYLKNLASEFHTFYNTQKVLDSNFKFSYLKIFAMVSLSIELGLKLLGIEAKRKM